MRRTLSLFIIVGLTAAFAVPTLPSTPAPVKALLLARPFTLTQGFSFDWRQERPTISRGFLVVIEVNPDLVYPRQTAEPVLYVGDQTAMRLNIGYTSGRVIAVVPETSDLRHIWFGTPQLPERVTAETIANERKLAENSNIPAVSDQEASAALERGGASLRVANFNALLREAARLVRQYSDEADLARILESQGG